MELFLLEVNMILGYEENGYILEHQEEQYYSLIEEWKELLNKLELKQIKYCYMLKKHSILKKQYIKTKKQKRLVTVQNQETFKRGK